MQETSSKVDELKTLLKRCRPDVLKAALDYQSSKESHLIPIIVNGIIERYLEPEAREKLKNPQSDQLHLIEDLGMDSLIFVEIAMTVETTLAISIPDSELRTLRTLKDVQDYTQKKVREASSFTLIS